MSRNQEPYILDEKSEVQYEEVKENQRFNVYLVLWDNLVSRSRINFTFFQVWVSG